VLDAENFILKYIGNESNTFGTGFMINMKYKQAIMNFEVVGDRTRLFRIRRNFNILQ
jgi:hypothetical protein